jgi:hypothetical protein
LEVLPIQVNRTYEYDTFQQIESIIKQNTELRKAVLYLNEKTEIDQRFVDAFGSHKHLTELTINILDAKIGQYKLNDTFCGLKSLTFISRTSQDYKPDANDIALFGQLTNLKRLTYQGPVPLINVHKLEKLTSLELINPLRGSASEWQNVYQSLSALTRLMTISLQIEEHGDDDYHFLASLPSLESIWIKRNERQRESQKIIAHLNNSNLTKLSMRTGT